MIEDQRGWHRRMGIGEGVCGGIKDLALNDLGHGSYISQPMRGHPTDRCGLAHEDRTFGRRSKNKGSSADDRSRTDGDIVPEGRIDANEATLANPAVA